MSTNVVEASGLGKRYGSTWALRECTLAIPAGHVAALVGPNGAGKTTLLNLAVGLAEPSAGGVSVLGGRPAGSLAALDGIAFVAQDTPLYKNLSAADMLHLTRNLNRRFDQGFAQARLAELGIPLKRKAGRLSGGQRAQLALTLALARRPRLLLLDEPVAMLDPVARHDFMATVLTAAVDDGVSVLLSSHVLAELERVADYLILLSRGRVQVAGEVDDLLASHRVLTGPTAQVGRYAERPVVHVRRGGAQAHLLVRATVDDPVLPGWALAKLVLLAVAVAAATGALSVLLSWYYQPYFATGNQALGLSEVTPFFPGLFDLRGVAFAAWTLAAFAIGALAGMLIRRVVPAIAATLAVYAGLAFAAGGFLRQHYLTPLLTSNPNVPGSAWIFSQWWTKDGQFAFAVPPNSLVNQFCSSLPDEPASAPAQQTFFPCFSPHGYTLWTSYQPASRFWPFQWIEGGWLLALSVLLIAATVWLVRRRAA